MIGKKRPLTLFGLIVGLALLPFVSACSGGEESESPTVPPPSGKTYTPSELKDMIGKGSYPDQYPPTTQTLSLPFDQCVAKVNSVVASIQSEYPAEIVVDTAIMHMAKAWTNDGAMTMTCSQPDQKLVLTNASYR